MGEQKFSIIFALGNESSRERKLAEAKVPCVFAPRERMFPTENFRSRERKYRRAKRP